MFRTLARLLNDPTLTSPAGYSSRVFQVHPYQLSQWLEGAWSWSKTVAQWLPNQQPYLGNPGIIAALELPDSPDPVLSHDFLRSGIPTRPGAPLHRFDPYPAPGELISSPVGLPWDHAIYSLIIESTGVYEILAEVTRRYAIGETLEPPTLETEQWLRSTEELFFRQPPLFHITGIASQFRPDMRVTRRNLYWRLLGMDLPHPLQPGHPAGTGEQPWKQDVGVANVRFHELWIELLRQVWVGYENATNTSGPNPTDPGYILEICKYLREMLTMRRLYGQLAREEFVAVSQLSWFHLTVEDDTPLVKSLKAEGADPYDRLVKIGQRVGMRPSPHAWELFEMADFVSQVVRAIELNWFNTGLRVQTLYMPGTTLQQHMLRIIDLWEMATGDGIKDQGVRMAAGSAQPQRHALPARSLSAANGHRPVAGSAAH
jgi:hypothetical protein